MSVAADLLGASGPFSDSVEHYRDRPAQREMAAAVETAIGNQQSLLVEAGTGTGKTYAYLVPIITSGCKAVVSTATKQLQDQLYYRDLPKVLDVLQTESSTALLKGRSNYVCWHRLEQAARDTQRYPPEDQQKIHDIKRWVKQDKYGDIADAPDVAEQWPFWPAVTSNTENCVGQECDFYNDCFVVKARRKAQEADVVVVNHYLLFADMALKEEGFGDLLPTAEAIVIDEAHHVPEIATRFFGLTVTSRQILNLSRDTTIELGQIANDMPDLQKALRQLEHQVSEQRLSFGDGEVRGHWNEFVKNAAVNENWQKLCDQLAVLVPMLKETAERSTGLESCYDRGLDLAKKCKIVTGQTDETNATEQQVPWVSWVETRGRGFAIHATPLDISKTYQQQVSSRPAAWIYASATLAVGNDFSHFSKRIGLQNSKTLHLDSPFDFQKNTLLYLPKGLPEPRDMGYTEEIIERAIPLIKAAGGRCFFLFTSYRALQMAERILTRKIRFPLLVQGQDSRRALIDQFRKLGNAVLLGTSSFWEGVDVRGDALSLVIIDKLPFAAPNDPVVSAKIDNMRQSGQNPFNDYQVPHAVISLKQGVGRLIRDYEDTGVLMLCDPRLTSKRYGQTFLNSLPSMPVTHNAEEAAQFFEDLSLRT